MCSKLKKGQKNMVHVSLIFFGDVLSRKNVYEACSVKNYGSVVQMPLFDNFYYFW
jgi:hypothetical protein